jgi:hypothetical protein
MASPFGGGFGAPAASRACSPKPFRASALPWLCAHRPARYMSSSHCPLLTPLLGSAPRRPIRNPPSRPHPLEFYHPPHTTPLPLPPWDSVGGWNGARKHNTEVSTPELPNTHRPPSYPPADAQRLQVHSSLCPLSSLHAVRITERCRGCCAGCAAFGQSTAFGATAARPAFGAAATPFGQAAPQAVRLPDP